MGQIWDKIKAFFNQFNFGRAIGMGLLAALFTLGVPLLLEWALNTPFEAEGLYAGFGLLVFIAHEFSSIFYFEIIKINGILFTSLTVIHYLGKRGTLLRLVTSILFLFLTLWLITVGSSIYSLFLPHETYATISLQLSFLKIAVDYHWFALGLIAGHILLISSALLAYLNKKIWE